MSHRKCGSELAAFGKHTILRNTATVHFKSDHRGTQAGFKIRFAMLGEFMNV